MRRIYSSICNRIFERLYRELDKPKLMYHGLRGTCYRNETNFLYPGIQGAFFRQLKEVIAARGQSREDIVILELGGATGYLAEHFAKMDNRIKVVNVDFGSKRTVAFFTWLRNKRIGRKAIEVHHMDVRKIDSKFFRQVAPDAILAVNLFHFIEPDKLEGILRLAASELRPGAPFYMLFNSQAVDSLPWVTDPGRPHPALLSSGEIKRESIMLDPHMFNHHPVEIRFLMWATGFSTAHVEQYASCHTVQHGMAFVKKQREARSWLSQPITLPRFPGPVKDMRSFRQINAGGEGPRMDEPYPC